jgi:hypothetical protein
MRVFIAIPIPLLILGAIVLNGVTDKDPPLFIPPNIATDTVESQVKFGDKARKAKQFDLAFEYCEKGTESEDFMTQMTALNCMTWGHKANGDVEEALAYAYRRREWNKSKGFEIDKFNEADIAELEKMR